jgi:hypothetical protein
MAAETHTLMIGSVRQAFFSGSTPRNGWGTVVLQREEGAWYSVYLSTEERPTTAAAANRDAFDGDISSHETGAEALLAAVAYLAAGGTVVDDETGAIIDEDAAATCWTRAMAVAR